MLGKSLALLSLLLLTAVDASRAQATVRQDTAGKAQNQQSGAWSAKSTSGVTLMGSWTAVVNPANGTVMGTWTLVDAQGKSVADGAWSAAKSPTQWTGAWRAIVSGRNGEYSGTWTARTDLNGTTGFADLFAKAVEAVVSGSWRAGSQSGAWSIRAAK